MMNERFCVSPQGWVNFIECHNVARSVAGLNSFGNFRICKCSEISVQRRRWTHSSSLVNSSSYLSKFPSKRSISCLKWGKRLRVCSGIHGTGRTDDGISRGRRRNMEEGSFHHSHSIRSKFTFWYLPTETAFFETHL